MKRPRNNFNPVRWEGKKSQQRTQFSASDRLGMRHGMNASLIDQWAARVGVDLNTMEQVLTVTGTAQFKMDIENSTMDCIIYA